MNSRHRYFIHVLSSFAIVTLMPACSLIFGTDKPVDTKSHDYNIVRLDRESEGQWQSISTSEGDVAYEHKSSGTIISLNSVCGQTRETSLEDLSKYLLLGIDTRGQVEAREIEVAGVKALESTVEASMGTRKPSGNSASERPVKLKAVVLRKGPCTYDLMYIAQPQVFKEHLPTFERFLKGFHAD